MSQSVSFNVTGMKCGGCEANVTGQLQKLEGVISVTASSKENSVIVEYDPDLVGIDRLTLEINQTGYQVVN